MRRDRLLLAARIAAFDFRPILGRRRIPSGSPAHFFFPDPARGSACKRWNLYLRWMVRRDRLDYGLWPGIPTDRLVIPTDTHIHLVSRRLGLTRRKSADWKTAREITDRLARFDPAGALHEQRVPAERVDAGFKGHARAQRGLFEHHGVLLALQRAAEHRRVGLDVFCQPENFVHIVGRQIADRQQIGLLKDCGGGTRRLRLQFRTRGDHE